LNYKPNKDDQLIYGIHAVEEAVFAGKPISKVLVRQDSRGEGLTGLIKLLRTKGIPYQHLPRERFRNLNDKTNQGIVAFISPVEFTSVEEIVPFVFEQGKMPLLAILDNITDVRNIGAISRSALCFGIDALVLPQKGSGQLNADAVKTSAGALLNLPLCREKSLINSIKYLKDSGLRLIGCSEKADKFIHETDFTGPVAIVMGAEGEGISSAVWRELDEIVKIRMTGSLDSLNVSVAAGIIFHEAQRQRVVE
jgi:23S rRNA (guanosine2251-2'-O)-methyltransferase